MIPKTIHYCWFGRKPIPAEYQQYMKSWSKFCSEYSIIEWNEDSFDVLQNSYCKEAYEAKKWAFVSDYARLKILYEQGGIYLDTDVELLKNPDPLSSEGKGFIGYQNKWQLNTGLGFAAAPHDPIVEQMLKMYENIHFSSNGTYDMTPCPVRNTVPFLQNGLVSGNRSKNIETVGNFNVLPTEYLNPLDPDTGKLMVTKNSYAIHHYAASWLKRRKFSVAVKALVPASLLHIRTNYISHKAVQKMLNCSRD